MSKSIKAYMTLKTVKKMEMISRWGYEYSIAYRKGNDV